MYGGDAARDSSVAYLESLFGQKDACGSGCQRVLIWNRPGNAGSMVTLLDVCVNVASAL